MFLPFALLSIIIFVTLPLSCLANEDEVSLERDELHDAIRRDDLPFVKEKLSEQGVDMKNGSNWAPWHVAAFYGSLQTARYLLEKKANLSVENDRLEQPLHLACLNSHMEIVKLILTNASEAENSSFVIKALIDAKQIEGKTPLFYAAKSEPNDKAGVIAKLLLGMGASAFVEDSNGMQAIHEALVNRNSPVINMIIQVGGEGVQNEKCCKTMAKTLSHLVAEYNLAEFVQSTFFNVSALDGANQTPFCWAARNGSYEFAKNALVIFPKVSPNAGNCIYGGNIIGSPLHVATYHRHIRYVQFLLENGANASGQDSTGATPLHVLASVNTNNGNQLENGVEQADDLIAEMLIAKNEFLTEEVDFAGRTPFLISAMASNQAFAEKLRVKWNANPSATDNNGYNAFHLARENEFIDYLVKIPNMVASINDHSSPWPGNVLTNGSLTPLQVAVKEGKPMALVRHLINHRAKVDLVNDGWQNVLHLAVETGNLEAVSYFAKEAAELAVKGDKTGQTPLVYAIRLGNLEATKTLLQTIVGKLRKSIDSPVSASLDTPLHVASRHNMLEIVSLLIENGANMSALNADGQTPVHEAVVRQSVELVRLYAVKHTKNFTQVAMATDRFGRTPLHLAARCNRFDFEMAGVILSSIGTQNAATILAKEDNFGETPLHRAVTHESVDLVKLLLMRYNAGCLNANKNGQSPFGLAEMLGYKHISAAMLNTRKCSVVKPDCTPSPSIRLTGGANATYGFVEIFHETSWGLVCDDGFEERAAKIICRSLCLSDTKAAFYNVTTRSQSLLAFGPSLANSFWLDDIRCRGSESQLEQCRIKEWGENDCKHNEKIAVFCR